MTLLCNWITLPLDENFSKSHYTHYTSAQSAIPDRVPSHRNLSFHLFSSLRLRRWDLEPQPDDCSQNSMAKSNLCRRHNTQFTNNYAIKINFYCHPVRQLVFSFHATDVQRGKRRMDYAMDWRTRRGECALCCAHRVVKYADEIRIIFFFMLEVCEKCASARIIMFGESSLPSTTKLLQIEMFIVVIFSSRFACFSRSRRTQRLSMHNSCVVRNDGSIGVEEFAETRHGSVLVFAFSAASHFVF